MLPGQTQSTTTVSTPGAGATLTPAGWQATGYYAWESAMGEAELGPERILLTALDATDLRSEPGRCWTGGRPTRSASATGAGGSGWISTPGPASRSEFALPVIPG